MPTKTRIIFVSLLILLGGILFSYCLFFYTIEIATVAQGASITVTASEAASVKDASTGCAEQDKSNQTTQSSSSGRSRPRSGST